ncbi:Lar family restriction alleviation protein [Undibacterium crateris]|uniref:Lar family restriction alleviation protein n=1 Tax=Undibacterium crateris TaxID=2528175 RepID=UPI001389ADA1|nr:Lar family restriction alleviation protein [Undibacterium crateris]NDI85096.1 hypothetical protein [Undibacterium crateris]
MNKLKPCPHCGKEPIINHIEPHRHSMQLGGFKMPDHPGSFTIECCGGMIHDTLDAVTSMWNTRSVLGLLAEISGLLQPGEVNAGLILDDRPYFLVLVPQKPNSKLRWADAMEWANSIGFELPTRREFSLLLANCSLQFDADSYWSRSPSAHNDDYAFMQRFHDGNQSSNQKSREYLARAVRRIYLDEVEA